MTAATGTSTGGQPSPDEQVGGVVRSALGWSLLNNLVGRVGGSLVGIVLARILVPEDYGVYAVALVVLGALLSLNELGVSLAIVRWPGDVERIAPTVATIALTSSAALYVACFAVAPTVATALGAPGATGLLRVLALGVLVDAVTEVPAGVMTRGFLQRRRLVIDTAAFTVTSTLSIGLAMAGAGPWSLAWGSLAGNVTCAVFLLAWSPQRFRPGWDRTVCRKLLAFGLPLAAASALVFAMLNVDYVIVGSHLGVQALGFYLLAFNLSSWPVNMFSSPVRRVSMPAFARLQHDPQRVAEVFARAAALLVVATLPACVLLAVLARPLLDVVYGTRWAPAAAVLPCLAVLALVRVLVELGYDLLVALGRTPANLSVQGLWLLVLVPALLLGARHGIVGVARAHALVAVGVVLPALGLALRRAGVSLRRIGELLVRPALGAVLAALVAMTGLHVVSGSLLRLALSGSASLLCYVAVVHPLRRLVHGDGPATQAGRMART